jgi:hypothetical protein
MIKRKRKVYDDDDGRVIAPMNVEGMPWYNPYKKSSGGDGAPKEKISWRETIRMIFRLYAAVIPIALAFIVGFAALIFFMVFVWFR